MNNKLIVNLLVLIILAFVAKGIFILESIHPEVISVYKCVQTLEAYFYLTGVLAVAIGVSLNISTPVAKQTDLTK